MLFAVCVIAIGAIFLIAGGGILAFRSRIAQAVRERYERLARDGEMLGTFVPGMLHVVLIGVGVIAVAGLFITVGISKLIG